MQKLAGNFLVKRSAVIYLEQRSPDGRLLGSTSKELYELPSGVWQFGKGKDATVVTDLAQVEGFGEDIQTAVATWLECIKHLPPPPPMVQGQAPAVSGDLVAQQLHAAIHNMSPETQARLLEVIKQTLGPSADSVTQGEAINHHGAGYGQDQEVLPPGRVPFTLPPGARYVDPQNPAAGYLKPTASVDEEGKPIMAWHETPAFAEIAARSGEAGVPLVNVNPNLNEALAELEQERTAQGDPEAVGGGRLARRRR